MERYQVVGHLRLDPEGTVTSYADAQATVEALQAQNAEWERKCRDLCLAHGPLLIEHHDVKRDLTQLQALVRAYINARCEAHATSEDEDAELWREKYRAYDTACTALEATLDATTPVTKGGDGE